MSYCLRDYVGLRWCANQTTPPSGLWLNSFAGVSFKQMQSVADEEQKTFSQVWSDIQDRATLTFQTHLTAQFAKRYKLLNPKKSYNLSKVLGTTTYTSGTLTRSGFTVRMYRDFTDYPDSLLSAIHCQQLMYYAASGDAGETTTVQIFDIVSGEVLFSDTVTLVAGWNTINVNQSFTNNFSDNSLTLFCCIDSSGLTTTEQSIAITWDLNDNALNFNGATSTVTTDILDADVTESGNSYGLTGIFSSICTYDAIVCQNKELFKAAWAYNLIVETMDEILYTNRLNAYTMNIGRDRAAAIKEEYINKRNESLLNTCESINLDLADNCLECYDTYILKEDHP